MGMWVRSRAGLGILWPLAGVMLTVAQVFAIYAFL